MTLNVKGRMLFWAEGESHAVISPVRRPRAQISGGHLVYRAAKRWSSFVSLRHECRFVWMYFFRGNQAEVLRFDFRRRDFLRDKIRSAKGDPDLLGGELSL